VSPDQERGTLREAPPPSRAWRGATAASVAVAIAFAGTGFHVVPTTSGWWRGVSDPPGFVTAAVALLVSATFAWLLQRAPVEAQRPFLALALAVAPLVPVFTGRLLALLFFQGPVITVIAIASVTTAVLAGRPRLALPRATSRGLVLFSVVFASYAALGTRLPGAAGPQGDEPHYLLMTESLLRDHDLDLANQFEERAYAPFYAGTLAAHTSPASPKETIYAVHTPGLPALLLPAYALGGYPAARLLLSALTALTTVLVHALVRDVTKNENLALAAWAVSTFTPPLPFYAVALYPETPAALATAVFLWSGRGTPSGLRLTAAALAAAFLPWLHPKFLPLAGAGLGFTLLRPTRLPLRVAALLPFAASTGLLFAFFDHIFGRASLSAAYGPGFAADLSLGRVPWGLAGLFLDRQFGLWSVSPVWALALPGWWLLHRQRTGDALRSLSLAAAILGVGASFSMWWGGACPPARFAVPAVPALALSLALALATRPRAAAALAGLGLSVVLLAAQAPRVLHNRSDGESALLRFLAPALDLDAVLPSFVLGETRSPQEDDAPVVPVPATIRAPLLATTLTSGLALGWARGAPGLALGAAAYAVVAGGLRERPLIDPAQSARRLIDAWDGDNVRGLRGPPDLRSLAIPLELPRRPWTFEPQEVRNARRLDLPPGLYRLEVAGRAFSAEPMSRVVRLDVTADGLLLGQSYLREGGPSPRLDLFLPTGARRMMLTGVGIQGQARVDEVLIVPELLVPRSLRAELSWPRQPAEGRYRVAAGGLRITVLDRSEPEEGGFRLQGGEGSFVVEAPAGTSVVVSLTRPQPALSDRLVFGDRHLALGHPTPLRFPADAGIALGTARLISVRLEATDGWIAFAAAP